MMPVFNLREGEMNRKNTHSNTSTLLSICTGSRQCWWKNKTYNAISFSLDARDNFLKTRLWFGVSAKCTNTIYIVYFFVKTAIILIDNIFLVQSWRASQLFILFLRKTKQSDERNDNSRLTTAHSCSYTSRDIALDFFTQQRNYLLFHLSTMQNQFKTATHRGFTVSYDLCDRSWWRIPTKSNPLQPLHYFHGELPVHDDPAFCNLCL